MKNKKQELQDKQEGCNCDEKTAKSNNIHVCLECLPK